MFERRSKLGRNQRISPGDHHGLGQGCALLPDPNCHVYHSSWVILKLFARKGHEEPQTSSTVPMLDVRLRCRNRKFELPESLAGVASRVFLPAALLRAGVALRAPLCSLRSLLLAGVALWLPRSLCSLLGGSGVALWVLLCSPFPFGHLVQVLPWRHRTGRLRLL